TCDAVPPRILKIPAAPAALLPDRFRKWFAARGWSPREHQLELLQKAREDRSALLIAPTGAGKTLAGFLPTLVELSTPLPQLPPPLRGRLPPDGRQEGGKPQAPEPVACPPPEPFSARGEGATEYVTRSFVSTGRSVKRTGGLHTLYISPLKALAVD